MTARPTLPTPIVDRTASIVPVPVPELGNTSYVVVRGDEALVIDPPRDVREILAVVERRHATVSTVLETHVHNDYLSGAHEVRAATGASIAAPAKGRYRFDHRALDEGDEIVVGDLILRALHTPGHTPEHMSYLVLREGSDRPEAVLTGGSLLVGSAGRSDLLGLVRADELNRAQFRSLTRLRDLPPDTSVLPTHGAGSFCSADDASALVRISTIGEELAWNAVFRADDEDEFLALRTRRLAAPPSYFRFMAEANRSGVPLLTDGDPPLDLSPAESSALVSAGAWIVDARDRRAFAAGHIPGSVWVPLDGSFATNVGSVVPFGESMVLVLPWPERDLAHEAVPQLQMIGYGPVLGFVSGGVDAWRAAGRPLTPLTTLDPGRITVDDDPATPLVLDVRSPAEWEAEPLPNGVRIPLSELTERIHDVPRDRPVVAACAFGRRAVIAASVLQRLGVDVAAVTDGGVQDLVRSDALEGA